MSLRNYAKLGLIPVAIVALLGAPTGAKADPGVTATDNQAALPAQGMPSTASPTPNVGVTAAAVSPSSPGADASAAASEPTTSAPTASATPTTAAASTPPPPPHSGPANTSGDAGQAAPPVAPANTPAISNTTTQVIWQVQSSGCRLHCHGTSQTQTATQQSTTVRVTPAPLPVTPAAPAPITAGDGNTVVSSGAPSGSADASHLTSGITQTQLGCQQYCFGTTTLGSPDQLTDAALNELLGELEAFVPSAEAQPPAPAINANAVEQTTTQFQDGSGGENGPTVQIQTATQTAATVQILPSSPPAELQAFGLGDLSVATTLNQTLQGIWQLQIGCIFDCSQTQQSQQAQQSSAAIQVLPPLPDGATGAASAANSATGLIWQFQVGCLSWCYDAVEVQTASSDESSIVIIPPLPPPPTPASGGAPSTSASTSGPAMVTSPAATAVTPPTNWPITAPTRPAPPVIRIVAEPWSAVSPAAMARLTPGADGMTARAAAWAPLILGSPYRSASPALRALTRAMPAAADRGQRKRRHRGAAPTARPKSPAAVTPAGLPSSDGILLPLIAAAALILAGFVCQATRR